MDQSCLPALLDVARPALPPQLAERLDRWDGLDEGERERAAAELRMMAVLMRRAG